MTYFEKVLKKKFKSYTHARIKFSSEMLPNLYFLQNSSMKYHIVK